MSKFNFIQYDRTYVMRCKTAEEAEVFERYLRSVGLKWCDGSHYRNHLDWEADRCYRFREGSYGSSQWYVDHGCKILNFSDFDWSNFGWTTDNFDIQFSFDEFMSACEQK